MTLNVETNIEKAVAKYSPKMAREITAAREKMRAMIPRGYEMVYDNYNALVFAYCSSERPSEAQVSIAAMPRWVTLFFIQGVQLDDPKKLLLGDGSQVRSVRLEGGAADLDRRDIRALIDQALAPFAEAFAAAPKLRTVLRSVSEKQRARRPKGG
ncbi:DUF1801 domain-containing protein [Usitatibacter rugosus]|nr:DUF1801 domain-containing protein [Usitatibacter rugosus]